MPTLDTSKIDEQIRKLEQLKPERSRRLRAITETPHHPKPLLGGG